MTRPPDDLPPAAKLVFKTLDYEGECRFTQLKRQTALSGSTVTDALRALREGGHVEKVTDMARPNKPAWRLSTEYRRSAEVKEP